MHDGFTLIEILVVISMLAILLSIVAFSGDDARATARATVADQDVQQIGLALQLYLQTNNELPASIADLYPDYLSKEMSLDPWGNAYEYQNNYGTGSGSLICSVGPDESIDVGTDAERYETGGDDICRFIFDD